MTRRACGEDGTLVPDLPPGTEPGGEPMATPESPEPTCRACGDPLDYRTAETDLNHIEEQLILCRACFEEVVLSILRVWTWSPYPPPGAGQVERQRWGRRKTDC